MTEHDETLDRMIEALKEPVAIDPALDSRIMSSIEQLPQPGRGTGLRTLLVPRWTLRVSPLGGLAAAAALAAVALAAALLMRPQQTAAPQVAVAAPTEQPKVIQLVLIAPDAKSVAVVGDFNDWSDSATRLVRQQGDGVWWVTLELAPGRYRYAFVVDGTQWRNDPNAPMVEDDFGRANSVVTIGGV